MARMSYFFKKTWVLIFLFVAVFLSSCATPRHGITNLKESLSQPRILVMPLDVEMYEISMGGIWEFKADWTQTRKNHLEASIR